MAQSSLLTRPGARLQLAGQHHPVDSATVPWQPDKTVRPART